MDLSDDEMRELKESNPTLYISLLESKLQMVKAENQQIRTVSEVTKQRDSKHIQESQAKIDELTAKVDSLLEYIKQTDYESELLMETNEQLRVRVDQLRSYLVKLTLLLSNLLTSLSTHANPPVITPDARADVNTPVESAHIPSHPPTTNHNILEVPEVKSLIDEITQLITLVASSNRSMSTTCVVPVVFPPSGTHTKSSEDGKNEVVEPSPGLTAFLSSFISRFFTNDVTGGDTHGSTSIEDAKKDDHPQPAGGDNGNDNHGEISRDPQVNHDQQCKDQDQDHDEDRDDDGDDDDDGDEDEDIDIDDDGDDGDHVISSLDSNMDSALEHIFDSLGPQALHGYVSPDVANDLYFRYSLKKLRNTNDGEQSDVLLTSTSKVIMTSLHSIFPKSILDEIYSPLDITSIDDHHNNQQRDGHHLLEEIATKDAYVPSLSDRLFAVSDAGQLGFDRIPRLVDQQAFLRHQLKTQMEEQQAREQLMKTMAAYRPVDSDSDSDSDRPIPSTTNQQQDQHPEIVKLLQVSQQQEDDGSRITGLTVASINLNLGKDHAEQLQDASAFMLPEEIEQYHHQSTLITTGNDAHTIDPAHLSNQLENQHQQQYRSQSQSQSQSQQQQQQQKSQPLYINPETVEFKLKYKKVHRDYVAEKQEIERKLIRDLSSNIITEFVQAQPKHKERFLNNIESLRTSLKQSGDVDFDVNDNEQFMQHLSSLYEKQFRQDLDQQLSQELRDKLYQVLANPNSSTANKEQAVFILERRLGVKHRPDGSIKGYQVPTSEFTSPYATSTALQEYQRIKKLRDDKIKAMAAIQLAEDKAQGKGVLHFFKDVFCSISSRN